MKVIVTQFIFESNTFNPVPAELDLFTPEQALQTVVSTVPVPR